MFFKVTEKKIKDKKATRSNVGKGSETIINMDNNNDEVSVRDEQQVFVDATEANMETNHSKDEGSNKQEEDIWRIKGTKNPT